MKAGSHALPAFFFDMIERRGFSLTARLGVASFLGTILMSAVAGAAVGDCPVGQTVSADTAGHCCWPAQAWSTARAKCVGEPQCPPGSESDGDTCVGTPQAPAKPATPAPPPKPAPPPTPPPSTYQPVQPSGGTYQPVQPSGGVYQPVQPSGGAYQPVPPAPPPTAYKPVAPPAPPPHVPVRFEPRERSDDRYRITADGKSCTTPCTLDLPAGELRVQADAGGRSLGAPLHVPGTPAVVEVSHRSRGHLILGGALLVVGVADIALGGWFAGGSSFDGHEAVGGVAIGLGAVAAIVGIVNLAITSRARLQLRAATAVGVR